jgi:serine/threonine-protein kinase
MTESHPSSDTPIPTVLAPGLVVADKYELLRLIGQGGMGEVWAARHRSLGEDVAIKFLVAPSRSDPDAMLSRFQLEAQIAAHLSRRTRHIASVIDYGQAEGIGAYLVMELVGGTSLEAIIRRGQNRDLAFASMIVNQLAKGLSVAHDAGVVHRDQPFQGDFFRDGCRSSAATRNCMNS